MKVGFVLAAIILAFFLISLIRVGGILEYGEPGLLIRLRLGRFYFTIFPMKPKKAKPEKKRKKETKVKPEPESPEPARSGNTWELLKRFLPVVADAAGRFKDKVRIDRLDMDLTVAARDPATAAIAYGAANGAIGMMIPVLEHNFKVKERQLRTRVDFDRTSPKVRLKAAFSLTIGQGTVLGLRFGVKAFQTYLSYRKSVQKQKEAV